MGKLKEEIPLPNDPSRRLIVEAQANSFTGKFTRLTVKYADKIIGQADNNKQIRDGIEISATNGARLRVRVARKAFGGDQIEVLLNGKPLKNMRASAYRKIKDAAQVIFLVVGLNIILAIATEIFEIQSYQDIGIGWSTGIASLVYLLFGYLILKQNHNWIGFSALVLAIAMFIGDTFVIFKRVAEVMGGGAIGGAGIGLRVVIFYYMIRAIMPAWKLRQGD